MFSVSLGASSNPSILQAGVCANRFAWLQNTLRYSLFSLRDGMTETENGFMGKIMASHLELLRESINWKKH